MANYDFASLFRSTVGFDRLLTMIDSSVRPDWPPYDIEKHGEKHYRITMAVAGFAPDEIELVQQSNVLHIAGQQKTERKYQEMLHQGLAVRNFRQTFNLADHVTVVSAGIENGLLLVELIRELPEPLKARRIEIRSHLLELPGRRGHQQLAQENVDDSQAA